MRRRRILPAMKTILVVDDERNIVELVRLYLEKEGFAVVAAADGEQALAQYERSGPDLVVLDLMLPKVDGFEVCRELRRRGDVPILMLTARSEDVDAIVGLELGADDYVTKPFGARELVSRVKAVLRRSHSASQPPETILRIDDRLSVDFNKREVIVEGKPIKLRPTEYRLLYHLIENAGWTVPHEQLLAKVWGYEYRDETHYVRLYVNYLREKIEEDPANPKYILTERGLGYRFVDFRKGVE
jgi:DNA-binding response OmpR family regulator